MHTNSAISMASANGRFVAKAGCAPWVVRPLRTSGFDPSPERSMQLLRYAVHRAAMGDCRATSEAGRRRSEQWRSWALVGHEAEAYRAAGCAPDVRYRISTLFPLTPRLLKVLGANERPSDAAGINESGSRWIVAFCQSCHHMNRSPPPCVNFMNVPLSAVRQGRPCIRPALFHQTGRGRWALNVDPAFLVVSARALTGGAQLCRDQRRFGQSCTS